MRARAAFVFRAYAYAYHPKMVRLPGWWELPRGSAPQFTADRVFRLRIQQLQLSSTCVTTVSICILSYAADGSNINCIFATRRCSYRSRYDSRHSN